MPLEIPKQMNTCIIRNYEQFDIEPIADIEFDAETKKYVGLPGGTKEDWIAKVSLECLSGWVVVALPENIVAGRVCLNRAKDRTPGVAEIEVIIGKQFWGRKLGREVTSLMIPAAFKELNAVSVLAEIHPENSSSVLLFTSFGFKYLREAKKRPMQLYELTRTAAGY